MCSINCFVVNSLFINCKIRFINSNKKISLSNKLYGDVIHNLRKHEKIRFEMCCNRLEVQELNCISKSQTGFRNEHPTSDIILTLYFISDTGHVLQKETS